MATPRATLTVAHPACYPRERAYILDVVLGEFLGLAHRAHVEARRDTRITIPGTAGSVTLAEGLFAVPTEEWLTPSSLPRTPLARIDLRHLRPAPTTAGSPVPVLYGDAQAPGRVAESRADGGRAIGIDILGGSFFMLTRYEEVVERVTDVHGRFPVGASLAHRERFVQRPLVNEYCELLWSALSAVWPRLRRRPRSYGVRFTHDVDHPVTPWRGVRALARSTAGDLARRRDPALALRRVGAGAARGVGRLRPDVFNTFDFLMDVSESRGCSSAFYVMAEPGRPDVDGGYALRDPFIARLLGRVHRRGHEIGLHPTYDTFTDPQRVAEQFGILVRTCDELGIAQGAWGGRQHFLRWESPRTWRAWDAAGLDYDSSVGFPGEAGFRAGVCFEYPAFDLERRARLRLRERPLIVMEGSLFDYAGLSCSEAADTVMALAGQCRRFAGDLTVLWHNSSLASGRDRRLYQELARAL